MKIHLHGIVSGMLMLATLSFVQAAEETAPGKVLFNGADLVGWRQPMGDWRAAAGVALDAAKPEIFNIAPGKGVMVNGDSGRTVDLMTGEEFGDIDLHVEFCVARRSNSGVYLQGRYEIQIYDSFGVEKDAYPGIECGGIYPRSIADQGVDGHSPRVNASKPAGEWQSFDILFKAARFDADGKKIANARMVRVLHNGQLIHENIELKGPTRSAHYSDEKALGPILLQGDHGPVAYRNLRVKAVDLKCGQAAPGQPENPMTAPWPTQPSGRLIKIMPLGDSLTQAFPGYRAPLFKMLLQAGFNIQFVGPKAEDAKEIPEGLRRHAGHGGFGIGPGKSKADQWTGGKGNMAVNIAEWMKADPDIILLNVGINDYFNNEDRDYKAEDPKQIGARYAALIDQIHQLKPKATILASSLTPFKWDPQNSGHSLNSVIPGIVQERSGAGRSIRFVDMHDECGFTTPDWSNDGLHPSDSGYNKMAGVWYHHLNRDLLETAGANR